MVITEAFVLALVGAGGGLVTLVFSNMKKSRCVNISCCFGLISCKREIGPDEHETNNSSV